MTRSRLLSCASALAAVAVFTVAALTGSQTPKGGEAAAEQPPAKRRPARKPVAMSTRMVNLEILPGLKDTKPTTWDGTIEVSEGRVVEMEVFSPGSLTKPEGNRFRARSVSRKQQMRDTIVRPRLRVRLDAPESATVNVTTEAGKFAFKLSDIAIGITKRYLEEQVSVEREEAALRLTGPETEDDYPVMAQGKDGVIWLAYLAYQSGPPILMERVKAGGFEELEPKGNGDQLLLQRFDGKVWQTPLEATPDGQRIWRPAVTVDGKGDVWVAWSQYIDGDWEIFYRRYTPPAKGGDAGRWSETVRLTREPGADFHVVAATDAAGTVWLAWQGWRKDNFDIHLAAPGQGHSWNEPRTISHSSANDWTPAIAADSRGRVYVAWDTYDKGNYDVLLFTRDKEGKSATMAVAESPRFEGRPNLVCDKQDRLWIAYEEGDEQWGKDYGDGRPDQHALPKNKGFALYINRTVQVKCLADGKLRRPAGDLQEALAGTLKRKKSLPRLAVDAAGGLWLVLRHHPLPGGGGEVWNSYALRYQGRQWSPTRRLASSGNLLDNRPALTPFAAGILAVYSGDGRVRTQLRDQDDLFAAVLTPSGPTQPAELADDEAAPPAALAVVHKNEKADIARMREYRVTEGDKKLRLLRGDFHRHTEYSSHGDIDGLLEDAWRYAYDAADLDWIGNGDHDNGFGSEYMWWQFQRVTDLFQHAPRFVGMHVYERSVIYPNGHRNVIFPRPGIRPLPRASLPVQEGTPEKGAPDTKLLYAYLKHFGAICSSHTSGTQMGTDWRDNDPTVEPVVEIYQGCRHNYEHSGAPRSATEDTQIGGYRPKGYVWNALEKGYRLGFQSSSDHVSTHMSYAVVFTDDVSRKGIIDAFKKRHSYGATDNIILDVHCGEHVMGDSFNTAKRPALAIHVEGTAPIAKVHVIRDNKYVYSAEPNQAKVDLRFTDMEAREGKTSYYYVRIEQADGNLAWASPMWITYQP